MGKGASASADRAGGLRPEPQASQPKALIPCADKAVWIGLTAIELAWREGRFSYLPGPGE